MQSVRTRKMLSGCKCTTTDIWRYKRSTAGNNCHGEVVERCLTSTLKTIFLCARITVFSVTVFYDERVVIVAEQRPDASEEDSFQWMSRVLQVHLLICFQMFFIHGSWRSLEVLETLILDNQNLSK